MSPADPVIEATRLPLTLTSAVALVSVETLAEVLFVGDRHDLTPGLRVCLILCLALKWLFAWRLTHRSAGAALGLLLLEATTVVAALGAVDQPAGQRLAVGLCAALAVGLVSASLHAFPPPNLPKL
jgi:hypothetical protein